MSDEFTNLNGTLNAVWERLEAGPGDPKAPANTVVLATSSTAGPSSRVVILRGTDQARGTLDFYTHAASAKVSELADDPRAALLIWDAEAKVQIRLTVTIEMAGIASETWASLGAGTRLNYAVDPVPGTPINAPEDAWLATPEADQMVHLKATILRIDTLQISSDGLRRATFADGRSQWIAP